MLVAARGLFVAVLRLLSSCGTQALERTGSTVAVRGLSCCTACGILVPQPGVELASPALGGRFLTTGPPGKSVYRNIDSIKDFEKMRKAGIFQSAK